MESDFSESKNEKSVKVTNKTRLSLFLPPDVTTSESTKTKAVDKEYMKLLKIEEETWKQLYNDQKEQKYKLVKELESNEVQCIDYSLFDEQEIKYINAGPNIAKFIQEVEDLENLVKYVGVQCEAKRRRYNCLLENIEKDCLSITFT